jgi:transcription initiation factor IIE alpha subunit
MKHEYQYFICHNHDDCTEPLAKCPECGNDLNKDQSILLDLIFRGKTVYALTFLQDGVLMDTFDESVAEGYHSATRCARCEEMLIHMENVLEEHNKLDEEPEE